MINQLNTGLSPKYFAAHLPLYPIFIRIFSLFGYLRSMLLVNFLFTVLLSIFFYYILRKWQVTKYPLLLVIVFLFLPRFLVVRSIGAPESLFILLVLASLVFFEKENYLLAGFFGGLSAMTKTPGILLFAAYVFVLIERLLKTKKINWSMIWLLLIPTGLISVFFIYWIQYGDFLAYFHTGGLVPMSFPFSVFNFNDKWVGTAWLEDIIFYFFLYGYTVIALKNSKYRSFFYFTLIFFIATTLVDHRDIARYSLPLWPLACIALEQFFTSRKFLLVFIVLLPAIYLYAWNFLLYNQMPISIWRPFL